MTEVWSVLAGLSAGRVSPEQVTVFDSVGFAMEDFSALRYVRDQVEGTGFAQQLDLVADSDDPKDLFGFSNSPILVS